MIPKRQKNCNKKLCISSCLRVLRVLVDWKNAIWCYCNSKCEKYKKNKFSAIWRNDWLHIGQAYLLSIFQFYLFFKNKKTFFKWFELKQPPTWCIYISIIVFFSIFTCCRVSLTSNKKPDREVIQSFTQPTFRITNLKPNTTYNIAISANNSHGRSRPHELVAQTDEGIFH